MASESLMSLVWLYIAGSFLGKIDRHAPLAAISRIGRRTQPTKGGERMTRVTILMERWPLTVLRFDSQVSDNRRRHQPIARARRHPARDAQPVRGEAIRLALEENYGLAGALF
jgi:hypothetical protein